MTIVAIAKQETYNHYEIKEKLNDMLESIDILEKISNCSVLIKPNCTGIFSPEEGRTTHPIVLEALIEVLQHANATVIIGESSSVNIDTLIAYEKTGVKNIAEKQGIKLIDFKTSKYYKIDVENKYILNKILLPQEVLDADYIISLAKMKTNYVTTISCSLKNLKGLLLDNQKKQFHHIGLSEAVADLFSVVKNNTKSIAIVDGILGSELYEPRKGGVLIASTDFVASDSICAEIMGVKPTDVKHLKLAYEKGLGEIDIDKITIYGDALFSVNPPFISTPYGLKYMEKEFGVNIIDGNPCSTCIGGLYLGLKKIKTTKPELLKEGLRIAVGDCRCIDNSATTIYYGVCSHQEGDDGLYVAGCAPTSSDLIEIIENIRDNKNGKINRR